MSSDTQSKKVLVVEDETDMILYLSTLIASYGFEPVIARNETEGIQKAREESPGCVILNGMMQGEEGISMYIRLKTDSRLKKLPVILLSAIPGKTLFHYRKHHNTETSQEFPEPEAYLQHPPEAEELIRMLQEIYNGLKTDD